MPELTTAVHSLVRREPTLIFRIAPFASLRHETNNTASSQAEGIIFAAPTQTTGVVVREEFETTVAPVLYLP